MAALTVLWRILDLFVGPNWFLCTDDTNDDTRVFLSPCVCDACVCEECALSVPVSRILGRSGFVYSFDLVEDAASGNIKEIIFLGSGLMWEDVAVFCGRMELKILVRD